MKRERLMSHRKNRKGRIAAVLALAVLLGAAPVQKEVAAVDMTGCEITVALPQAGEDDGVFSELQEAVNNEDVVLDVYQVAGAEKLENYDTYKLVWSDKLFQAYQADWDEMVAGDRSDITADEVIAITQKFAEVALKNVPLYKSGDSAGTAAAPEVYTTGTLAQPVKVDAAGLYLMIPHGKNLTDYVKKSDTEGYSTVAEGYSKFYQFAPMLVSIPIRGELDTIAEENTGTITVEDVDRTPLEFYYDAFSSNSADENGDWVNSITLTAKVGEGAQFTKFRVEKNLDSYESMANRKDTGTFVFGIEIKYKDKTIMSDVQSIVLNGDKTSGSFEIDNVPIDAIVTVTEKYPGGDYEFVSADLLQNGETYTHDDVSNGVEFTAIPVADDESNILTAHFDNTYTDTFKDGGSVTNHIENDGGSISGGNKNYSDGREHDILSDFNGEKVNK